MSAWSNSWTGICYRHKNGNMFSPVSTTPPSEAKSLAHVNIQDGFGVDNEFMLIRFSD
jgi:hypothetical protein